VLILLPPSEGKTGGGRGKPYDLGRLGFPGLNDARGRVLGALTDLCRNDPARAAAVLGLGPTQADEVTRNASLSTAPARPAADLYTGVLYEALDFGTLPPAAKALLRRTVAISSGLWGAVRLADRIPAYRCAVGVALPGVGGLAAHWRRALPAVMAEAAGRGLVIDLRSGAYAAIWTPPENSVTVRVLHERVVDGVARRSVVSHFNKATKGRLVRDLALAGASPRTPAALVEALRDLKYTVETTGGKRPQLDVVVTEL
jgi:cytoplasmic iron level regulating protein YaaA (DUF328/UPF0246 family)